MLSFRLVLLFRPVLGPTGGLCGLSSLYAALANTILTESELTELSYPLMRGLIAAEMNTTTEDTAALTDEDLLKQYYACKGGTTYSMPNKINWIKHKSSMSVKKIYKNNKNIYFFQWHGTYDE